MEINIKLNDFKYRYDVYQMFNIYFPLDEIKFSDLEGDYYVNIDLNKITFDYKECHNEVSVKEDEHIKETIKKVIFESLGKITKETYPWGTLVGIRPSKIALKLLREGKSEEEIKEFFYEKHFTYGDKVKLCIDVANSEDRFVNKDEKTISIYIGMAFCPTRCLYCSFASNPIGGNRKLVSPYLEALNYEIEEIHKYIDEKSLKVETVYFGGGTPTSIDEEEFENIMNKIYNSFVDKREIKEFTVECGRPDSITMKKLETMKKYDVSRISINPQTMNDKTLSLIGRNHTSSDVIEKFNMAKSLGFEDINMDMIIGLPGEGLEEAKHTAEEIRKLSPDSLTVHGLSLKRGSIMYENFILKKGLGLKSQDEVMKMYSESKHLAESLKLKPYYMYRQKNMVGNMENLGYAKEGKECIYNIQMIEDKQTIIALGADAVTKAVFLKDNRIERFGNVKDVREYVNRIKEMVDGKKELLDTLYT
ncbi:coproporphyrinogen III oxidase [Clostridium sp. SHJSY1]|uniref:coproporphyrinogen III oxidase n=1 Tax=Clostridium sp. SHJSY1 TaxID=2942483 RepID=UPI002876CB89|nr:coproporphyrinogen III oxidase [Clostridium sp. SHJSY1]MDS0524413.1 coproporphyrinogen III oxidase [Clostridium sp. SHJSY1]